MKAAINTRYGAPDVVQIKDVPKPEPAANELLIRVRASTVNRTDCGFRSAEYFISRFFSGLFKPKNHVLGNEFAGEVEAVGSGVSGFKAGDRVCGYNDLTFGAHAEYMRMPADGPVVHMPANLDFATAAAISEGAHYALCDIRAANVQAGQQVLVNGATGAIGSAAVQLLKHFGAVVTAVCATPHLKRIEELGAARVIDYTATDFTRMDVHFDLVFDAVGKSTFGKCRRILKPKGIYISTEFGPYAQNVPLALFTPLLGGKKLLFPLPTVSKADIEFLKQLAETGAFKPLIDRQYPLDQIRDAYRYVETGQKTGNVIINI